MDREPRHDRHRIDPAWGHATRTDLRMLAFLQLHGRASNLELAEAVCLDQIKNTGALPLPG